MTKVQGTQEPSPILFFNTLNAYQRTAALKAAIELDLFTGIAQGNQTPAALARICGAAERGIRILCDYLTIIGFLSKEGQTYQTKPEIAPFVDQRSPAYLGKTLDFMLSPTILEGFQGLTQAVRNGGTVLKGEGTIAPEHHEWVTFAQAMIPMMIGPAQWIAQHIVGEVKAPMKVLDIAAGHGMFGIEIAKICPQAEVVAVDWPPVLTVAQEQARKAGVGDRYRTIAGSAFEVSLGQGYDLVLLTNFLHHFDIPTCETFLRKVRPTLVEGGRVVTLEFVPNDDRISPESADFSVIMLATTPAGDAYTFAELDRMFRNAGFAESAVKPVPQSNQHVVITDK